MRRLLLIVVFLLSGFSWVRLPPGAAADASTPLGQILQWNDQDSSFVTLGANTQIIISLGNIGFVADCPSGGTNDSVYPWADVYVVPAGSVSDGTELQDVSGHPHTVQSGGTSTPFIDEPIGVTAPQGPVPAGTFAVVYDECQDGTFNAETDALFDPAFKVIIPTDVPPLPNASIQAVKTAAAQEAHAWLLTQYTFQAVLEIRDAYEQEELAEHVASCVVELDCGELVVDFMNAAVEHETEGAFDVDPEEVASIQLENAIRHYLAIAADPPDTHFQQSTLLAPRSQIAPLSNDPLGVDGIAVGNAGGNEDVLAEGLLHAIERYQGAAAAHDGPWALVHAREIQSYAGDLLTRLNDSNAQLTSLGDAIGSDPRDLDSVANGLSQFRQRVATSGFTADEMRQLRNLAFTQAQIADVKSEITGPDYTQAAPSTAQSNLNNQIAANNQAISALRSLQSDMAGIAAGLASDPSVVQSIPAANAGGPYSTNQGAAITLDGSGSTSAAGSIIKWEWDTNFDGQFDDASGPAPSVTFDHAMSGLVGLRVTDTHGQVGIGYAYISVSSVDHGPIISASSPDDVTPTVLLGASQAFSVTASDPDGDPVAVSWSVDGSQVGAGAAFVYTAPSNTSAIGVHVVRALVTDTSPYGQTIEREWGAQVAAPDADGDGWNANLDCNDTDPTINPGNKEIGRNGKDDDCIAATQDDKALPRARFASWPVVGHVGQTQNFADQSATLPGYYAEVSRTWDFGDGATSTAAQPTHLYQQAGVYDVTLTATDSAGNKGVITKRVTILGDTAPDVGSVAAKVTLPYSAIVLATNPATNRVYLGAGGPWTEGGDGPSYILVLDGDTNQVLDQITLSSVPTSIAVNPVTNRIYVFTHHQDRVTVIDGATDSIVTTLLANPPSAGVDPGSIAVNPTTNRIYVGINSKIAVIDGATNQLITRITIDQSSSDVTGIDVNPITNRIYAARFNGTISVIDGATNALLADLPNIDDPVTSLSKGVRVDPDLNQIYVANYNEQSISVFDGNTNALVATINSVSQTSGAVLAQDGRLYVAGPPNTQIPVVDGATRAVLSTISTGGSSPAVTGLASNPTTNRIYGVTSSKTLYVIQGPVDNTGPQTLNTMVTVPDTQVILGQASVTLSATVATDAGAPVGGGTITFTLTGPDGSSVGSPVSVDVVSGAASTEFSLTGVPAGVYSVEADYSGNEEFSAGAGGGTLTITDSQPPTSSAEVSPAPNAAGWNNDNVTVVLTADDGPDGSGVQSIKYSLSGAQIGSEEVTFSPTSIAITEEGTTTVTYLATDQAGNQETVKTLTVQIDKTPPVINVVGIADGLESPEGTAALVQASDALSGMGQAPVSATLDGGTYQSGTPIVSVGDHTLTVTATDNAGNEASQDVHFNIVNVPPQVSMPSVGPEPSNEGSTATASATFADPGNDGPFACSVNYGDGSGDLTGTITASTCTGPAHTYDDNGQYVVTISVTDGNGGTGSNAAAHAVNNVAPTATFGAPSSVNEGDSFTLSLANPRDTSNADTAAGFSYTLDCGDGSGAKSMGSANTSCSAPDVPRLTVQGSITDKDSGSTPYAAIVTVNNVGPTIGSIAAPIDPVPVGTAVDFSAPFTDPGIGRGDVHTATWSWGDGTTSAGTLTEAGGAGSVTGSRSYTAAGVYTISLGITDKDGASSSSSYQYVVVYDPSAGFVTGGGWITSPAGAYTTDPTLTGKASFGFVAKYEKGATVPSGSTEFQFHAAGLDFHSTNYQWLVISGPQAQYKGVGTINGQGNYGFLLTARDGQASGGAGTDTFRLKIWVINAGGTDGGVVYDNGVQTPLGGGSIVIHS